MLFRFYRNDELRKTMANILRNKRGGEIKSEDAFRQQQGRNSLIKTYTHVYAIKAQDHIKWNAADILNYFGVVSLHINNCFIMHVFLACLLL